MDPSSSQTSQYQWGSTGIDTTLLNTHIDDTILYSNPEDPTRYAGFESAVVNATNEIRSHVETMPNMQDYPDLLIDMGSDQAPIGIHNNELSSFQSSDIQLQQQDEPHSSGSSPSSTIAAFPSSSENIQHTWVQVKEKMPNKTLAQHVAEVYHDGVHSFFCGWPDCKHPVGFTLKNQVITHMRSAHLQERTFLCIACNTSFARKQDAIRHVVSMNRGKQYRCSICQKAYSRKHYRDTHEERCLLEATATPDQRVTV
ncbi:hypothetical protein BU17DRAFT_87796 [Hysterangium stoloniferum]|nr:hypothetical protein BU17DRAFT_87796 [Hysterangium stoloniferum]